VVVVDLSQPGAYLLATFAIGCLGVVDEEKPDILLGQ